MPRTIMQTFRNLIGLLIGLFAAFHLNADDINRVHASKLGAKEIQLQKWQKQCESINTIESVYFKRFADNLIEEKQRLCQFSMDSGENYLNELSNVFNLLKPYVENPVSINSATLMMQQFINAGRLPQVTYEPSDIDLLLNLSPTNILNQSFDGHQFIADSKLIEHCDQRARLVKDSANCRDVLQEFARLYSEAQSFYSLYGAIKTEYQLKAVMEQWDDYLALSRSQTPLELMVNGYFYKKQEAASFQPPPNGQVILLHPGLVIEDVSDAADGENTKQSLMVEVIGYNWWQQEAWYLPSGFSYTRIYTDRAGVKDWGDGVSLHFRNQFTLGYSRHKDEEGVYISVDLLKLFEDKQKVFKEYRQNF